MIFPVEIANPFSGHYGGKTRFKMPQEIETLKTVTIKILKHQELIDHISGLPIEIRFDVFKMSLLLNNGNDEVIADAPAQLHMFQVNSDWRGIPYISTNEYYEKQKIILNKKIIKNSVHYAVFKMPENLIHYLNISSSTSTLGDYLRSDDFKLMLYLEAA